MAIGKVIIIVNIFIIMMIGKHCSGLKVQQEVLDNFEVVAAPALQVPSIISIDVKDEKALDSNFKSLHCLKKKKLIMVDLWWWWRKSQCHDEVNLFDEGDVLPQRISQQGFLSPHQHNAKRYSTSREVAHNINDEERKDILDIWLKITSVIREIVRQPPSKNEY